MEKRRGRKAVVIDLDATERETLERWARRPSTPQGLAMRCRVVLGAAQDRANVDIAAEVGCSTNTVSKWRNRFAQRRLDGLYDNPRPGPPRRIDDAKVEEVVVRTLEETPADATHWSTRSMARAVGLSQSSILRIWRAFGLKPHRTEDFKISPDPLFVEKVRDLVGLYMNPPDAAVVLCVTTNPRYRPSTAPHRSCLCCPEHRSGSPTTTAGMGPPTYTLRSTPPAAGSSPL